MNTLQKNSRGEQVKLLQKALNLYPDGIFGKLTEEAVKDFQEENGLVADGIVGPKTWAKLNIAQDTLVINASKRRITKIIVHCTATRDGQHFTVSQIRDMHVKGNGWSDIGYHYLIYLDGTVHNGRNVNVSGAHCENHNSHSIGVCYVGGLDKNNVKITKDTRTEAQKKALRTLLKELKTLYPNATIHGHNEFANKDCPCFDVQKEYADLQ